MTQGGTVKQAAPMKVVRKAMLRLRRPRQPTVSELWDHYAKTHLDDDTLGDEWSVPERIGIAVAAENVVDHLVDEVFRPFLGSPDVLLEIGAGGGRFTEPLRTIATTVIATDTSPTMLKILDRKFASSPSVRPMLLDGYGLAGIGDETCDAVFSYGVFVHLQHWDFYNYLAETKRVLKPGGRAIIQHANMDSELGWQRFLDEVKQSLNRHKLGGSFTVMTPELMRTFVERAGLVLDACRTDVVRRDGISLIRKP